MSILLSSEKAKRMMKAFDEKSEMSASYIQFHFFPLGFVIVDERGASLPSFYLVPRYRTLEQTVSMSTGMDMFMSIRHGNSFAGQVNSLGQSDIHDSEHSGGFSTTKEEYIKDENSKKYSDYSFCTGTSTEE